MIPPEIDADPVKRADFILGALMVIWHTWQDVVPEHPNTQCYAPPLAVMLPRRLMLDRQAWAEKADGLRN